MQYLDFRDQFKDFLVFDLNEIRKVAPDFDRRRLTEWQKKGYLTKIIRGYYTFSDIQKDESLLFVIANRIYEPSYISLEMALSFYHLIPESVYQCTSVSSRKTCSFVTPFGKFSYQKVKKSLMFGYRLVEYRNQAYKIAELEKALLDYLYFNNHLVQTEDFEGLRLNPNTLAEHLDRGKFDKYTKMFNNKALTERAQALLDYMNHA